jgi:hypothetical protein
MEALRDYVVPKRVGTGRLKVDRHLLGRRCVHSPDQGADVIQAAEHSKSDAVSVLAVRNGVRSYLRLQLRS